DDLAHPRCGSRLEVLGIEPAPRGVIGIDDGKTLDGNLLSVHEKTWHVHTPSNLRSSQLRCTHTLSLRWPRPQQRRRRTADTWRSLQTQNASRWPPCASGTSPRERPATIYPSSSMIAPRRRKFCSHRMLPSVALLACHVSLRTPGGGGSAGPASGSLPGRSAGGGWPHRR